MSDPVETSIVSDPKKIAEWLKNEMSGRLPVVRINALADVIAHSAEGRIVGWGFDQIVWETSIRDRRSIIQFLQ